MNRSVCKEWPESDATERSPGSAWNRSCRNAVRSRSRSPERWGGSTSGQRVPPFQHSAGGRGVRGAVPVPQRDDHFIFQGRDFGEGIRNAGAEWPYFHCYSDYHHVHSDEIRESFCAKGLLNSSNLRRLEQKTTKEIPCRFYFYVQGRCRNGQNCRYLHDTAPQCEMRLGVPKHGQYSGTQSTQNIQNWQPAGIDVQTQLQTVQEASIAPYSGSGRVGAWTYHNATASEATCIINPYCAPCDGKPRLAAGYVSEQSTCHSRDPRFVTKPPAASPPIQPIQEEAVKIQPAIPVSTGQRVSMFKFGFDPSVGHPVPLAHSFEMTDNAADSVADTAPPPVPPIEQGAVMIQPAISASSGQQVHTVKVAFDSSDGHAVILSHSVELPVQHAANMVANSSESTKGEPGGSNVGLREQHDDKKEKARMTFRTALKKFVREQIKITWGGDPLTGELSRIVQKIIENVMRTEKNIPTEEKIGYYLRSNRLKIKKLIQDYIHKYNVEFP